MGRLHRLIIMTCMLTGCNNASNLTGSKVLATVNGDEITQDQVRSELLKSSPGMNAEQTEKQMLDSLIDRQLLLQEALKLNLDRAPEIIRAVESSKAQVYAQAYLSQKLAKISPTDQEVTDFIKSHPEIFEHRKLFKTVDVIFANDATHVDLNTMEQEITTLQGLQAELEARKVIYETNNSQFLTDRLPMAVLKKITHLSQGDLLFIHNGNTVVAKAIQSVNDVPMSDQMSLAVAKRLLSQQKKQNFIKNEIARLRKLSTIRVNDGKSVTQFR